MCDGNSGPLFTIEDNGGAVGNCIPTELVTGGLSLMSNGGVDDVTCRARTRNAWDLIDHVISVPFDVTGAFNGTSLVSGLAVSVSGRDVNTGRRYGALLDGDTFACGLLSSRLGEAEPFGQPPTAAIDVGVGYASTFRIQVSMTSTNVSCALTDLDGNVFESATSPAIPNGITDAPMQITMGSFAYNALADTVTVVLGPLP
jgi:hypothetical protein